MRKLSKNEKTVRIHICVPSNMHEKLNNLAESSMMSVGALIRQLIKSQLIKNKIEQ